MAERLTEHVCCGVCLEQYDNKHHIPKLLPCQHTFCLPCLQAIEDNSHSGCIVCPMCRSQHSDPAQHFTTHRLALDVAGELHKQSENPLSVRCAEHSDKDSVLICVDCLAGLCAVCMKSPTTGKHAKHQLELPSDARSLLKGKLMEKLKRQQAALGKTIRTHCSVEEINKAEDEIRGFCDSLISVINRWRDESLKTLKTHKKQAAAREGEILRRSAQLTEAARSDMDLNTIIARQKTKDKFEVKTPPVSPYMYNLVAACDKLLHDFTATITSERKKAKTLFFEYVEITCDKPGMVKFFTDAKYKGHMLVKVLESKHRCSIQMREEEEEDINSEPIRKVIFNISGNSPAVVEDVKSKIQAIIDGNYTETEEYFRARSVRDIDALEAEILRQQSDAVDIQMPLRGAKEAVNATIAMIQSLVTKYKA